MSIELESTEWEPKTLFPAVFASRERNNRSVSGYALYRLHCRVP